MHKLNTSSNYNFITALVARKIPSFSTASTATTASTTTVVLALMITAATLITANVGEGIYPLGLPKEDGKKKRKANKRESSFFPQKFFACSNTN